MTPPPPVLYLLREVCTPTSLLLHEPGFQGSGYHFTLPCLFFVRPLVLDRVLSWFHVAHWESRFKVPNKTDTKKVAEIQVKLGVLASLSLGRTFLVCRGQTALTIDGR